MVVVRGLSMFLVSKACQAVPIQHSMSGCLSILAGLSLVWLLFLAILIDPLAPVSAAPAAGSAQLESPAAPGSCLVAASPSLLFGLGLKDCRRT